MSREFRISDAPEVILQQAQHAADQGKWWQFIQLLGGTTTKRKDSPIRLMKEERKELGKYGDPIGQKICGVETDSIQLLTRLYQWRIEKTTTDEQSTSRLGVRVLLITVRKILRMQRLDDKSISQSP